MLILLTIFAVLLAVSILVFAKRRTSYLLQERPQRNLPAPEFRPLFEPGPEELRAVEAEEQQEREAAEREELKLERERKLAELEALRPTWRSGPMRKNTIELLYLASQSERGMIYAEIAGEIIKVWKNGQIENLSADDLSQLLESHFWLLPAEERTSGVSFSLREEIAGLRRKDHEDN